MRPDRTFTARYRMVQTIHVPVKRKQMETRLRFRQAMLHVKCDMLPQSSQFHRPIRLTPC